MLPPLQNEIAAVGRRGPMPHRLAHRDIQISKDLILSSQVIPERLENGVEHGLISGFWEDDINVILQSGNLDLPGRHRLFFTEMGCRRGSVARYLLLAISFLLGVFRCTRLMSKR